MKLVSVIVPVYNVEKYLCDCLNSIIAQTYKNIEVIIVDDGSQDNSGEICDRYARKYNNIYVVHKKNEGLGMARNTGLDIAKGEYVYFLDSDDYIDPTQIEILYKMVKYYGVDACFVGFKAVDEKGSLLYERKYKTEIFEGEKAKTKLLPKMLGSSPHCSDSIEMSASAQLYSMKPIREYGLSFCSERELISEDLVFNIDYLQYANGACTLSEVGNYYRQNPESLTHSYLDNRFEKSKLFYVAILQKLKTLGYKGRDLQRLQKSFFINIRMSIKQEVSGGSPNNFREKIKIIKDICKDEIVVKSLSEYPVNELGLKQQIFLILVKYKMAVLLGILL